MEGKKTLEVLISGRVQGVFFRLETQREAKRLGVAGWVMNLPDGRVRAVFKGRPEQVKAMVKWCKKGPPMARVDNVEVREINTEAGYEDFVIRY